MPTNMNHRRSKYVHGFLAAVFAFPCWGDSISVPDSVKAEHEAAVREAGTEFPEPATFIGSLDRVLPDPYRNVHGLEWGMVVRVEQVLIGRLEEKTVEIGIDAPQRPPLQAGRKYYLTVGPSRHGNFIYQVVPCDEK